jgi:hypothetical protein
MEFSVSLIKFKHLLELSHKGADVKLVFQDQHHGNLESLPAHSQILATWSGVLSTAICATQPMEWQESADDTSFAPVQQLVQCDDKYGHIKVIPMLGTSIAEWLEVSQFMYPVIPSPQVSWSNAEGLLALGAKYDMPAIVSLAGKFLLDNLGLMDLADKGERSCWRWLQLADAAGLSDVVQQCVSRVVHMDRASCASESRLVGLSCQTLKHMVQRLAATSQPVTPLGTFTCRFITSNSSASSQDSSPRAVSPHRWLLN